jgi:hypothetical protein
MFIIYVIYTANKTLQQIWQRSKNKNTMQNDVTQVMADEFCMQHHEVVERRFLSGSVWAQYETTVSTDHGHSFVFHDELLSALATEFSNKSTALGLLSSMFDVNRRSVEFRGLQYK